MDTPRSFEFTLSKAKEVSVDVRKILIKGPSQNAPDVVVKDGSVLSCAVSGTDTKLQSFEQAIIKLTKTDSETGEIAPAIAMFSPGNASRIMLAPGTYEVDVLLLRNERYNGEMTIKKESQTMTMQSGMEKKEIKYPDKDVLLPAVFTGGAKLIWKINKEELEKSGMITLYVFDEGIPLKIEDVGSPINHREACSMTLLPKLS
jgi:hypothetical protein